MGGVAAIEYGGYYGSMILNEKEPSVPVERRAHSMSPLGPVHRDRIPSISLFYTASILFQRSAPSACRPDGANGLVCGPDPAKFFCTVFARLSVRCQPPCPSREGVYVRRVSRAGHRFRSDSNLGKAAESPNLR